jgi:outer membrane receptor protein involved in Fe transport
MPADLHRSSPVPVRPRGATAVLTVLLAASAAAQTITLAPEVVTATRTPQAPAQAAVTAQVLAGEALRSSPAATLDGALRSLPAFSLFRRSDSLTANPTAQGVSLRGLGPSGASRSLVLLDGVPLNDPFGGWVAWSQVPREGLDRIEVIPGGGATAWGNAALGGVVQLLTASPRANTGRGVATIGDFGTRSLEFTHTVAAAAGSLDLSGRAFATDGFKLVAPERRGPVDLPAWSRHHWAQARWRQTLGAAVSVAATLRTFGEQRGNGTAYQRNGTHGTFGSVTLDGQPAPDFAWTATTYLQDQSFASTFGSINATRTSETPASDQFAVPARAEGASWTGAWRHGARARSGVGADVRRVDGETREHYTFSAGNFTRLRVAGGEQTTAGAFATHDQPLAAGLRGQAGARLDRWQEGEGHRRESDRASGALFRDDRSPGRAGTAFSPSLGLVWQPAPAWRWRAHAQRAFRRPTLNELYRPFRAGANVTEANPDLRTEQVYSVELGASHATGPWTLDAAFFRNELHDAVGNVTIARGPGTFPIVGTLAAGGLGRQRLNLDHTRVQGLELSARWTAMPALTLTAAALLNDARVTAARAAPALVGRQVAQVPRRSATLGAVWRAPARVTVTPRLRALGRQFEDDENQLTLGAATVLDLGLSRAVGRSLELFLAAENLGNARLETGRSADGVVNVGTPRLVSGGLRGRW